MAISSNPDQLEVKAELSTSSMTGDLDSLRDMLDYTFGDPEGDLRDFAGIGRPVVNSSLSDSNVQENSVDLSFTVSNYGGFNPCRISARYAESGTTNYTYTEFAQVTSDGSYTRTLSGLSSSTTYDIWVFVWNKFNDGTNFSNHGNFSYTNPVTNVTTDDDITVPDAPNILRTWWVKSGNDYGTEFQYTTSSTHPDDYDARYMLVDGSGQQYTETPSPVSTSGWSSNNNPKDAIWGVNNVNANGEEWIYVQMRSSNSAGTSGWNNYVPAGYVYPHDVSISEGSTRQITATWNHPPEPPTGSDPSNTNYYNASKTLSNSLVPVVQWLVNGSWTGDITLGTDADSASRDYTGDGSNAQVRVTYKTDKGYTSDWHTSNSIWFGQPYNLSFREESNNTLYAEWSNNVSTAPIEYQDRNDGGSGTMGSWGSQVTSLPAGTTEQLIGGNIPNGFQMQFRVRYQGGTWVTSSIYTI